MNSAKRVAFGATMICAVAALLAPAAPAADGSLIGPYFGARFKVRKTAFPLGQPASWDAGGRALATLLDSAGVPQVYRLRTNGTSRRCLTCRTVPGPSGFAQARRQGDWILFESYGQQSVHTGGPGLGGYGGDLYVMRHDGSHPYRLTTSSDPDGGAPYGVTSGTPYDNFHAYFSPDGRQIVWTHTEANPQSDGGQTWSMLVGDFRVRDGKPSLQNVRVVGKPYGAYETQPWAPDGSGFLFCAAGGDRSPFQSTPPGWGNMQVYYMRIKGPGASIAHPRVTRISDDMPAYEEQAILTPDMRTVIMMSNRSHTTPESWANLIVAAAQRVHFNPPQTGSSSTIQFLADFIPPSHFNSDLYAVDVRTRAIRQLTDFPRGIVPEFYWDRRYSKILFSNNNGAKSPAQTYVGTFPGIGKAARRVPARTPRALYGRPVRMSRVGGQAQAVRDPGPTDNRAIRVTPPDSPAPAEPLGTVRTDRSQVPAVAATYLVGWLNDLKTLEQLSDESFKNPPLLSAVGQFGG